MRFLVTGNNGFIGHAISKRLLKEGFEVIGIEHDIFIGDSWKETLHKLFMENEFEAVYHCGACSNTQNKDINYMMKLNFDFTYGLSLLCSLQNIPLIYSSSASIYGDSLDSKTLYAWSKYVGECVSLMANGVALRYFNVYGEGEAHKGAMASIMYQAWQKSKRGLKMSLFPMKPKRDFIYINDVVDANLHTYENFRDLRGNWYDVGTCEARTFEDALTLMGLEYEYASPDAIPPNYQFLTCAKMENLIPNWMPSYSLEMGVKKYLDSLNLK